MVLTYIMVKMESAWVLYRYEAVVLPVKDPHYHDKTVSRQPYLYNGEIRIAWEMVFILKLCFDSNRIPDDYKIIGTTQEWR